MPLDLHIPSRPYYSLRGFFWNVRTLGMLWWLRCAFQNFARLVGRRGDGCNPSAIARMPAAIPVLDAATSMHEGKVCSRE